MNFFFGSLSGVEDRLSTINVPFVSDIKHTSGIVGYVVCSNSCGKKEFSSDLHPVPIAMHVPVLDSNFLSVKSTIFSVAPKFHRIKCPDGCLNFQWNRLIGADEIDFIKASSQRMRVRPILPTHISGSYVIQPILELSRLLIQKHSRPTTCPASATRRSCLILPEPLSEIMVVYRVSTPAPSATANTN